MTLFDDEMMKALEADGEYLRQMTGEDHGPYFLGVGHRTMKVIDAQLMPLPSKHYSTDVRVTVSVQGHEYNLLVSVAGYAPNASSREKERGWEPDWGMDHTESETHLDIAQMIVTTLEKLKGQNDE